MKKLIFLFLPVSLFIHAVPDDFLQAEITNGIIKARLFFLIRKKDITGPAVLTGLA